MSPLETALARQIRALRLPTPEREYRFHPTRRFRFDFAWHHDRLAVEVEGGTWVGGRHTRGAGYERDCEKHSLAVLEGWRVLRVTGAMVDDGRAVAMVERAFGQGDQAPRIGASNALSGSQTAGVGQQGREGP